MPDRQVFHFLLLSTEPTGRRARIIHHGHVSRHVDRFGNRAELWHRHIQTRLLSNRQPRPALAVFLKSSTAIATQSQQEESQLIIAFVRAKVSEAIIRIDVPDDIFGALNSRRLADPAGVLSAASMAFDCARAAVVINTNAKYRRRCAKKILCIGVPSRIPLLREFLMKAA